MRKNIVIYPHNVFNNLDGGVTVQYYLAYILDKLGRNVMICNKNDNNSSNHIFNKFIYENEIDIENTIVIYSEGIVGNPLNAKYIVRWMLSKLGQNIPLDFYFTWKKNELVYFFNTEIDIVDKNIEYKQLSVFYLYEGIQNLNLERNGTCYTNRKFGIHQKITKIHPDDAYEITRQNSQQEIVEIFNNHHTFISYDPLTFLSIIAPLCGCISIVYPIEGISKKDYLKMTAIYDYLIEQNVELYGVAYGTDEDELLFAKNTIHLAKKQIEDIQQWFIDKYVINFIKDLDNFEDNKNILYYYKSTMICNSIEEDDLDIQFYKESNQDLIHMSSYELIHHYKYYGKNEGRFASEKQVKEFVEDEYFDIEFYKKFNPDLNHMSFRELIHHYKNYGKKEKRFGSQIQIRKFVEDEYFTVEFYKKFNPDLNHMSFRELIHHFKNYGKKEGRFGSEKQVKEFVEDENFDIEIYKQFNPDISHMKYIELIYHYKNYGKKEKRFGSQIQIKKFKEEEDENIDFDFEFYRKNYEDLNSMSIHQLIHHYKKYGKKEGRFCSYKQIRYYVEDDNFDFELYRKNYKDLNNMSIHQLTHHYKNYGKKEGRFGSYKDIRDFVEDDNFDLEFYGKNYKDLNNMSLLEVLNYYKNFGKKEGEFASEKQIKEFVEDENFDINFYKKNNTDLSHMSLLEVLNHYKNFGKKEGIICYEKNCEKMKYLPLNEFLILRHVPKINTEYLSEINYKIDKINYNNDKTTNKELYILYINWFNILCETKQIVITSPINNKLIYTDKYFIICNAENENTKYCICNYYFESEGIILGLGLGAGNHPQECYILYIYCVNEDKIFYGWLNYSFENFIKNIFHRICNFINTKMKIYNFNEKDKKVKTIYGLSNNMGHMLFNEYTGLYILNDYNIIPKIDEVIQGPHDIYYIRNYFSNFTNININDINNIDDLNFSIGKGVLFKFHHHFITDKCITFLQNNLNNIYLEKLEYKNVEIHSKMIKENYYPIINIVLRKGNYEMNNQSTTISNFINMVSQKYPNAFFYFDGFVSNKSFVKDLFLGINSNISFESNKNDYINLVNEISQNIKTTNYLSLINTNIKYLITHIKNSTYAIYIVSSASCNGAWICKIPGVQFGRNNIHIYESMDKVIRENNPDINYYNDKISYDEKGNFNIDAKTIFELIPNF